MELEKVQMEIADYRKQVSQLEMELESLRGTNDYLERNLAGQFYLIFAQKPRCFSTLLDSFLQHFHTHLKPFLDVEKRYEIEVNTFQQRVNRIQSELDKATNDMKKHLAEYKNLMNVKQSLEKASCSRLRFEFYLNFRKSTLTELSSKAKKAVCLPLDQVCLLVFGNTSKLVQN